MCVEDIDYTQLLVKILLQLGNYEQLRWHFQNLLQLPDKIVVGKAMGFPGGLVEGDAVGDIKRANPNANSVGNNNSLLGSSLLQEGSVTHLNGTPCTCSVLSASSDPRISAFTFIGAVGPQGQGPSSCGSS